MFSFVYDFKVYDISVFWVNVGVNSDYRLIGYNSIIVGRYREVGVFVELWLMNVGSVLVGYRVEFIRFFER